MKDKSKDDSLDLLRILNGSADDSIAFREHVKKESKLHYLMFWSDIELYRNNELDAISILETYFSVKSPLYISFPRDILENISSQFDDHSEQQIYSKNLFDEAYVFSFKILLDLYRKIKAQNNDKKSKRMIWTCITIN